MHMRTYIRVGYLLTGLDEAVLKNINRKGAFAPSKLARNEIDALLKHGLTILPPV